MALIVGLTLLLAGGFITLLLLHSHAVTWQRGFNAGYQHAQDEMLGLTDESD